MICVFVNDKLIIRSLWLFPIHLLLGRIAEDDHTHGKNVFGKIQHSYMLFRIFHNIADIARAYSVGMSRNNSILRRNNCVAHRQKKISLSGMTGLTARMYKCVVPFKAVCAEYKHKLCISYKWLMVAGLAERSFQFLICNAKYSIKLLISRRGRHCRRGQHLLNYALIYFSVGKNSDRLTLIELLDYLIHNLSFTALYIAK